MENKTSTLMKSVSGIRGIIGDSFTPELITRVAAAFAAFVKKGTVVIGRDTRPTGQLIVEQTCAVLAQCGCSVIDLGIVPTPTVEVAVEELKTAGGIVISASHNPIQWNAFKLINRTGTFLNEKEMKKFFALMEKAPVYVKWNETGTVSKLDNIPDKHIDRVLAAVENRLDAVKKKKFKVVIDSVNGAGSVMTPVFLKKLGCRVTPLYCEGKLDGKFPRGSEPLPENLGDLGRAVKESGAAVGFAQDPDADRLAIVNEKGEPVGEENTIALVTEYFMSRKPGSTVVVNMSTTKAVEDIARRHGGKAVRSKVGEINVVDVMRRVKADIGGEGNGGVISPEIHLGRDSFSGMAYVLAMMAERNQSLSQLTADLPQYVMKKGKIPAPPDSGNMLKKIAAMYAEEKQTDIDGLRIDFRKNPVFKGGWVHLRSSNTEPIFRIIAEGKTQEQTEAIYQTFADLCN